MLGFLCLAARKILRIFGRALPFGIPSRIFVFRGHVSAENWYLLLALFFLLRVKDLEKNTLCLVHERNVKRRTGVEMGEIEKKNTF